MVKTLTINETPSPKQRPRFGYGGRVYTPKETGIAEKKIAKEWKLKFGDFKFENPIKMTIIFYMPIPKSYSKKIRQQIESGERQHTNRPDLDNLIKLVMDGLNGFAYIDDCLVVGIKSYKMYSDTPRTEITISDEIKK